MDFVGKYFFRTTEQPEPAPKPVAVLRTFGSFVFDAVFEETHDADLEITDNPVETGVVVSDHAYMKPRRLKIIAGVSDTPLRETAADDPFAAGETRSKTAFELLEKLQAMAEPFSVQTGLKLYENMVVSSLRTTQDAGTANALVFVAELREIRIVTTQAVTYPPRKDKATAQQAGKKKEKGEKQGSEPKASERKSIAKALLDAGSSFFGKGK